MCIRDRCTPPCATACTVWQECLRNRTAHPNGTSAETTARHATFTRYETADRHAAPLSWR
ncbi:MAG: hypothetical protein J7457_06015, partial [Roseiflexus sp.]|nr:hypothetical protein [Roseiflexus sp.]